MIIYPYEHLGLSFADVVEGFNSAPKVGDDGHVDDHARLADVLFNVPHASAAIGYAGKTEDGWMLSTSVEPGASPEPATFQEVREFIEQPGVGGISEDPHDAADGVTDWKEDSEALDGVFIAIYSAGIVGLTHTIDILGARTNDFEQRLAALESAQA